MVRMKRKKTVEEKDGYSSAEMRFVMHAYIESSAERLRKRLKEAWERQPTVAHRSRHEVAI